MYFLKHKIDTNNVLNFNVRTLVSKNAAKFSKLKNEFQYFNILSSASKRSKNAMRAIDSFQ